MLKRQKMILALLHAVERPVTSTMLVKLAFLVRHEQALSDDSTYYDFVPYKFGPFSFALYRELGALHRDGYIARHDESVALNVRTRTLTNAAIAELPPQHSDAVGTVVRQYGRLTQKALLRRVYSEYPWYASRSVLTEMIPEDVPKVNRAPIAVYTVGYEGTSVDAFFDNLLRSGMKVLVDVRANPVSRKYGFAAKSLREIAANLGLTYRHLPELGIDGVERTTLSDFASYQKLLDRYQSQMLPRKKAAVERLIELIRKHPSALMCVERDVRCCHRGRLATAVAEATGLRIIHL